MTKKPMWEAWFICCCRNRPVREVSFQPGKYASTGFPIFLRALYDEGASKERLKAIVAGGALVGPIVRRFASGYWRPNR
jgi:hypothetical protein